MSKAFCTWSRFLLIYVLAFLSLVFFFYDCYLLNGRFSFFFLLEEKTNRLDGVDRRIRGMNEQKRTESHVLPAISDR